MKRILTIQDVSCVGKCSLTVAAPIISAAGVEAAVLPTAVLSTHTRFKNFTFCDLTNQIAPICDVWKREGITFDALYTGYLGSFEQMEIIERLIDDFRTETGFVFIDPVLGDGGKLYAGFTPEFAARMARFCGKADVVVPNMTEASAMLGIPYKETICDGAEVKDILRRLVELGPKVAVLTGVQSKPNELGFAGLDSRTGEYFSYFLEKIPGYFHGTGDIFASVAVAAAARGESFPEAFAAAADFVVASIRATLKNPNARDYGVDFETALPTLVARLNKIDEK